MNEKLGLYLFAPHTIFPKIKGFIDSNYDTVKVYGTSHLEFFSKDFFSQNSDRNLKEVVIVNLEVATGTLLDGYDDIVAQINLMQGIIDTKLNVVVLYRDSKILSHFQPLRQYTDLQLVELPQDGLQDEVIHKVIMAPMLKHAPRYVDYTPRLSDPVVTEDNNPANLDIIEPVLPKQVTPSEDITQQFETDSAFTTALKSIHDDLRNMELRIDVGEWSSSELQEALDSLDDINSEDFLNTYFKNRKNEKAEKIKQKIEQTDVALQRYEKAFKDGGSQDKVIIEQVNNLSMYKDSLVDVKEICDVQSRVSFYKALQGELVKQGNQSMEEFKQSLLEVKQLDEISDSKERIEKLKAKRVELEKMIVKNRKNFKQRVQRIEAELASQHKLLISQATLRKDDLEALIKGSDVRSNPKLTAQFNLDRAGLVAITNEINTIQEDKRIFLDKCRQIMVGYEQTIEQLSQLNSLSTVLINEQDNLISKLEATKTVQVVAKDILGTKLETFIGPEGVGVTTIAINYAQSLSASNKSVCIIDLDIETPELHRYLEEIHVTQDLADFVNMETSIDGLSELKTYQGCAYISNPYQSSSVVLNLDYCETIGDMYDNVIDKLQILARVFDRIIVIAPNHFDEDSVTKLYQASGKWFYVTDLNPTNLDRINSLHLNLKNLDTKKYFKFIINKHHAVDLSLISGRLGVVGVFNPIIISYSQNIYLSKLNGQIACKHQPNLTRMFALK